MHQVALCKCSGELADMARIVDKPKSQEIKEKDGGLIIPKAPLNISSSKSLLGPTGGQASKLGPGPGFYVPDVRTAPRYGPNRVTNQATQNTMTPEPLLTEREAPGERRNP